MASFGGAPSSANMSTDNPFAMPTSAAGFQQGSAEQNDASSVLGSYLDSMGGTSPRTSFTLPRSLSPKTRSRSARSHTDHDDNSSRREDRSREREPIGTGFRLTSLEQTTGVHARQIQQLKTIVETPVADRTMTGQSLDSVLNHVDMKFTEAISRVDQLGGMEPRLTMMTDTITQSAQQIHSKFEAMDREMERMQSLLAQTRATTPPEPPPGMRPAPFPPSSWTSAPPTAQPESQAPPAGFRQGTATRPNDAASPAFGAAFGVNFQRTWTQQSTFESTPRPKQSNEATFGQRNGPSNFYVGSPSSPLQGASTGPSTFTQWAAGAGSEHRPFDVREWSVEHKKPSKELKAFDGDMAHYDNWRQRVMDHFISVNCNYSTIFDILEKCKTPIAWSALAATRIPSIPHMNWEWLATHMWTFIGAYLNDTLLQDRLTLTHGEVYNGLELWRMLHTQNCGGGTQMANTERGYFVGFPKCEKSSDLTSHLGTWVRLKQKYGGGLPTEHLIAMFWKILPNDVREDVKKQKDCINDLDKQITYVYGELGTVLDDKLAAWNLSKLKQQVGRKPKNTTGIHVVGAAEEESLTPPPPVPDMNALSANIERMINATVAKEVRDRTSA